MTGGRGSLKSSTVHDFIARLTFESGHGILFTRYTMTSAKSSIIPEFKETLEKLESSGNFHIAENRATNKETGSFIIFSGIKTSSGNQTANLKSIVGITTWVIEEGEDFVNEKDFDKIDDSVRTSGKQNRVIWIQNPSTKEHFIYKRWIEGNSVQKDVEGYKVTMSNHPEVEHIHSTYKIAERLCYLSESFLLKAARSEVSNPKWYYHNYIGGWLEKAEGVIFENWEEGEFNTTLPYCFGLDYGFYPDPLALIEVALDERNKKLYIKEHDYRTNLNTDQLCTSFDLSLRRRKDLIVCDTNEGRTTNELTNRGYNMEEAKKRQIADDIRDILGYTIIVDPASENAKKELNNYIWNDKKSSTPIGEWNHLLDPMRYCYNKLKRGKPSNISVMSYTKKRRR